MSGFFSATLHPLVLFATGSVQRAIKVECPVCRARVGQACYIEAGKPGVHDARESVAFHGKRIWT